MSKFSDNFKFLRQNRKLTQQELADVLKISKSTISMYENGNRTPDYETLEAIADFFNVSLDYLLGNENIYSVNEFHSILNVAEPNSDYNNIKVIAAHALRDLNEEQIKKVIEYAKFIKSQEGK